MDTVRNNHWEELGRREAMIRNEYAKAKIVLKPKQGLTGDLSAEKADLVRLLHRGVKRRADGKEHHPLGIFDDDEDA